jgi:hypothetical protein
MKCDKWSGHQVLGPSCEQETSGVNDQDWYSLGCYVPLESQKLLRNIFSLLHYLKKIKGGLWDRLAVYLCIRLCLCTCVSPLIFDAFNLSVCPCPPPLFFWISMQSMWYRRKVGKEFILGLLDRKQSNVSKGPIEQRHSTFTIARTVNAFQYASQFQRLLYLPPALTHWSSAFFPPSAFVSFI